MLGKGSTWLSSCRERELSRTEQLQFTKAYNRHTCGGGLIRVKRLNNYGNFFS